MPTRRSNSVHESHVHTYPEAWTSRGEENHLRSPRYPFRPSFRSVHGPATVLLQFTSILAVRTFATFRQIVACELQFQTTFTCTQETRKRDERQETRARRSGSFTREYVWPSEIGRPSSPGFVRSFDITQDQPFPPFTGSPCERSNLITTVKVSSRGNCEESISPVENS